jgi:predicted transcriptional regulator
MVKRERLEIIKDILQLVAENRAIKVTPLLRKSNLSSQRFSEYFKELSDKGFLIETRNKQGKKVYSLTEKGQRYLEKYKAIMGFIDEFEL